jgi:hypothetical protein
VHIHILGPVSGRDPIGQPFTFVTTQVRTSGRGVSSDADRLEAQVKEVALEGRDITIDVREVEELGPDGIAALDRIAALVNSWTPCMLYILTPRSGPVFDELQASDFARAPRVDLVEVGAA